MSWQPPAVSQAVNETARKPGAGAMKGVVAQSVGSVALGLRASYCSCALSEPVACGRQKALVPMLPQPNWQALVENVAPAVHSLRCVASEHCEVPGTHMPTG